MGSSSELYNLGWSDFDASLKGAVKGLRSRGDLVDVTLAAGGKTFPAHKLVLSAASTLFLELLKVTPCQHPVILLAGIGACELEQVLDFIYTGEVRVAPSELSALLQAAHVLNINGLIQGSIHAEKPENQAAAEAALAASSEIGEKMDIACLAAATKTGILATVSNQSGALGHKRKANWKHSDGDTLCNKWRKCDSGDESSDEENIDKEFGLEKASSTSRCITSASITTTSGITAEDKATESMRHNLSPSQASQQTIIDDTIVPPHHLDMSEDEGKEASESFADIAAAADAAALAAAALADKKGISDQPAACPLCNAIIRQSRNLRRHLELKHFGKRPKKGKGGKRKLRSGLSETESNAGSVADTTVIEHVLVEMKSPSACSNMLASVPPSASSSPTQPVHKQLTLTELQPAHQQHNVESYLHQQQLQQLESFHHMGASTSTASYQIPYPHPHPHISMLRGDPHASIHGGEALAFRASGHQQVYSGSSRSSNHH